MRISVALCTYNGAKFLSAQLQSIARQSRPPDEIVVCDDASTDETRALLGSFAAGSSIPVSLHFAEQNAGVVRNFEKAIWLCTGDVIALSDQDDVWRHDKLQLLEQVFAGNAKVGLVFSDAAIVDEKLNALNRSIWDEVSFDVHKRKLVRAGRSLEVLIAGWTVTGATMAFRSEFRKLALPVPDGLPLIHDGWIALAIAAVAPVAFIEQPLIEYRQHARQQIGAPGRRPTPETLTGREAVETALRRHNSSAGLKATMAALAERLNGQQEWFDCRRALAFIADYSLHLDVRANLPEKKLSRVPKILRELITRRYHEYANGFKSAAKDLVS